MIPLLFRIGLFVSPVAGCWESPSQLADRATMGLSLDPPHPVGPSDLQLLSHHPVEFTSIGRTPSLEVGR